MESFYQRGLEYLAERLTLGVTFIVQNITWVQLLDLLLVALVLYALCRILAGTSLLWSLRWLLPLLLGSLSAYLLGLNLLAWLLFLLACLFFLLALLTFRQEMSSILLKIVARRKPLLITSQVVSEIASALVTLKVSRLPALLILRRQGSLKSLVQTGLSVSRPVNRETILETFSAQATLRGAMLIEGERTVAIGALRKKSSLSNLRRIARRLGAVVILLNRAGDLSVLANSETYSRLTPDDLKTLLPRLF